MTRGDVDDALRALRRASPRACSRPAFVEHAYIEPEAGWARARRRPHRDPRLDPDALHGPRRGGAASCGSRPSRCASCRRPAAAASAASSTSRSSRWSRSRRGCSAGRSRCVYTRPESMAASTKRHPGAHHGAGSAATPTGRLAAFDVARATSTPAPMPRWGPTVANRVPVHAIGPYRRAATCARWRAPSSPTARRPAPSAASACRRRAIAHEALMDELADAARHRPAGVPPAQRARAPATRPRPARCSRPAPASPQCLEALRPHWRQARPRPRRSTQRRAATRRGVGIGCMWYGIGNTSLSQPSTMRIGLPPTGTLTLYSGAVDIGQGSNTIMIQIAADALGVPVARIRAGDGRHRPHRRCRQDLGLAPDLRLRQGGASSPARDLRGQILRLANAGAGRDARARRRQAHGARRRRERASTSHARPMATATC